MSKGNVKLRDYINEREKRSPGFKKGVRAELRKARKELDAMEKSLNARRPSIAQLERILDCRKPGLVVINPDGSLTVIKKGARVPKNMKPLISTLRQIIEENGG